MKFLPQVFLSDLPGAAPTPSIPLRRLWTTLIAMACILLISIVGHSAQSNAILVPSSDDISTPANIAWASPGLESQAVLDVRPHMKINIEAFNKKREKDIANDSEKLLSLAIALKSELDRQSGDSLSADAIGKVGRSRSWHAT